MHDFDATLFFAQFGVGIEDGVSEKEDSIDRALDGQLEGSMDGAVEGLSVNAAVGSNDGWIDGTWDNRSEGFMDGKYEGLRVYVADGDNVGLYVGCFDDTNDGLDEIRAEGTNDGEVDGRSEGNTDGDNVGLYVGCFDDTNDGLDEIRAEGTNDGEVDGRSERNTDGIKEGTTDVDGRVDRDGLVVGHSRYSYIYQSSPGIYRDGAPGQRWLQQEHQPFILFHSISLPRHRWDLALSTHSCKESKNGLSRLLLALHLVNVFVRIGTQTDGLEDAVGRNEMDGSVEGTLDDGSADSDGWFVLQSLIS